MINLELLTESILTHMKKSTAIIGIFAVAIGFACQTKK